MLVPVSGLLNGRGATSIDRRDLLKLGGLTVLSRVACVPDNASFAPSVSEQSPAD